MRFSTINGITLHYRVCGEDSGRPALVFANSLGTDFRIWDFVVEAFAADFTIVTYDKRGHGLSDLGEPPYALDDHASDLEGLLDHLGIGAAVLCGLSVGGLIAQGVALRRPDLVRALILCDTALKIGDDATWNGRISDVDTHGIGYLADSIMERWFTPVFRSPDNPVFAGCVNMLVRQADAGYSGTGAAIRDADFREASKAIAAPTLCVGGRQDGATPPDLMAELAAAIPGARHEIIEECGHIPCIEQPQALVRLMRGFLADNGLGG